MLSTSSSTRFSSSLRLRRRRSTEQNIGDVLVRPDFLGRAVGKERTFVHHHDAIRITEYDVHVVLDDDRGNGARSYDRRHRVHNLCLFVSADATRGFIEKE